jgi:hypothetical protein
LRAARVEKVNRVTVRLRVAFQEHMTSMDDRSTGQKVERGASKWVFERFPGIVTHRVPYDSNETRNSDNDGNSLSIITQFIMLTSHQHGT